MVGAKSSPISAKRGFAEQNQPRTSWVRPVKPFIPEDTCVAIDLTILLVPHTTDPVGSLKHGLNLLQIPNVVLTSDDQSRPWHL